MKGEGEIKDRGGLSGSYIDTVLGPNWNYN